MPHSLIVGNSQMYPLLYTSSLDDAYALARKLIAHAVTVQETEALALTGVDGLRRFAGLGALPGVNYHTALRVPAAVTKPVLRQLARHVTAKQVSRFKSAITRSTTSTPR